MNISILGSGSSGNSTFVEIEDYKLLVDTGFSCKKTEEKLEMIGKKLSDISAILITHEHSDHINGAGVIARKYDIPIYITPESYKAGVGKLGEIDKSLIKFIDGSFILDDKVKVSPFDVMHDAERTIGFKLESQLNKKIAISTDIGYITNIVREYFKDVDAMVIESNYDFNTLMNCSYPWNLKERVKSRNGHLSNNECAKFIKEMYTDKLKKVFLAHVSKDSNHLSIIKETLEDEFTGMLRKPNCELGSVGIETLPKDKQEIYIGMGNRNADVLFIGNDPKLYLSEDYKVEAQSSGEFLIRLFDLAGIVPEAYYITTLTKREVKIKNFDEEEKKILLDLLNMQIALISPKIIVFLGKEVAQMIENREVDLEKERGKFKKWKGDIECYLTYDVETVIKARNESGKKAAVATNFWLDIKNIKERLDHNE